MFFYLINNSNLFKKSVNENDKYIKLLIYGTLTYMVLHAVLFVGGPDALFYNFRYYFWIILGLDIAVLFAHNLLDDNSTVSKLFKGEKDEIKNEYRVDIQKASINDIMGSAEKEQEPQKKIGKPSSLPVNSAGASASDSDNLKKRKRKKKEKKVTFDLTGGQSDFNKFAQPISNPNQISAESILSSSRNNVNKSTPLDSLLRDRATNPNDFVSGMDDVEGYQSFSDSESEYNSDLDMDSFEKGLTM
tara:strand:+ start:1102 stop:1839 length:738 start_codon:yes stop_codon:yes gene_type:complete